jgi:hypothetical protein
MCIICLVLTVVSVLFQVEIVDGKVTVASSVGDSSSKDSWIRSGVVSCHLDFNKSCKLEIPPPAVEDLVTEIGMNYDEDELPFEVPNEWPISPTNVVLSSPDHVTGAVVELLQE